MIGHDEAVKIAENNSQWRVESVIRFGNRWDDARERLIKSGYDLSKIAITVDPNSYRGR